jgi:RNA polymerase sigma-70 factor (ECF subfamily)
MISSMSSQDDQELMAQFAGGDEEAFRELVRRYQDMVFGTAYKMLGSYSHEAEDVAQQVFIRVCKAAPRYRPDATFKTWIMTITRNCVFTQLKRSARREGQQQPLEPVIDGESCESTLPDPEVQDASEHVLHKEMRDLLEAAVHRLPEAQRSALILRQYEQMDYESIAQVMKTSVPSIKSLLFRARDTLRNELQSYLQ